MHTIISGLLRHYVPRNDVKKAAFTLAEVLITLAVIGVVAALTIPTLMANINERVKKNQITVIEKRFDEGMRLFSTQESALNGATYENTEEFVRGLSKHFKMVAICGANNLNNCWPYANIAYDTEDGTTDTQEVGALDLASMGLESDEYYEPAGFITGAGIPYIVALKKDCTVDPDSVTANDNPTKCIAGIFDYSGTKSPNKFGKDVLSMNGAMISSGMACPIKENGLCFMDLSNTISYVDCSDSSSPDYKYCGNYPSGDVQDYWAGANKTCSVLAPKGRWHLASVSEIKSVLQKLWDLYDQYTTTRFWTSDEDSSGQGSLYMINRYYYYDENYMELKSFPLAGAICAGK